MVQSKERDAPTVSQVKTAPETDRRQRRLDMEGIVEDEWEGYRAAQADFEWADSDYVYKQADGASEDLNTLWTDT